MVGERSGLESRKRGIGGRRLGELGGGRRFVPRVFTIGIKAERETLGGLKSSETALKKLLACFLGDREGVKGAAGRRNRKDDEGGGVAAERRENVKVVAASKGCSGTREMARVGEAAEPPHVQHVLGVILPASRWVGSVVRPPFKPSEVLWESC